MIGKGKGSRKTTCKYELCQMLHYKVNFEGPFLNETYQNVYRSKFHNRICGQGGIREKGLHIFVKYNFIFPVDLR